MEEKERIIKMLKDNNKAQWFVQHIEEHLKDMGIDGVPHCKICMKDIDKIADEKMEIFIRDKNA